MSTEGRDLAIASAKLANGAASVSITASGGGCRVIDSGDAALMVAQALQVVIRHATAITPAMRENLAREIIAAHGECVKLLGVIAARSPEPQPSPAPRAHPFQIIPGGADHA